MKKLLLLIPLFLLSCGSGSETEQMPVCPCSIESIETIRLMTSGLGLPKTYSLYYKVGIKADNTYGVVRTKTKYIIGDTIL